MTNSDHLVVQRQLVQEVGFGLVQIDVGAFRVGGWFDALALAGALDGLADRMISSRSRPSINTQLLFNFIAITIVVQFHLTLKFLRLLRFPNNLIKPLLDVFCPEDSSFKRIVINLIFLNGWQVTENSGRTDSSFLDILSLVWCAGSRFDIRFLLFENL